ncbi:ketopantoate reductase family protein [Paenisporosarcina cavernae]|uniref:2-dehydropantoate 2-reductase n=1 Tax=Paenisporosarcina cavernae TaxID=2320858 RepID=A0A385YUA7_9BACL|nr:2-dehydropantoate 2-reductase [Paenisporosarcina cavernae]AYC29152.1 2-dehydropantoate 2-reductase [Paenisporosarcina cavernae]
MRFGIIGGGSIGLLLAYILKENGTNVEIMTRTAQQAKVLRKEGLHVVSIEGEKKSYDVGAIPLENADWNVYDGVFITVKSYDLSQLSSYVAKASKKLPIIFTQNGLSHFTFAQQFPDHFLIAMTIEHGAIRKSLHTVEHKGEGSIRIASFTKKGIPDSVKQLGISFQEEKNPWEMLLRKVTLNACINLVTALLKMPNGALLENASANRLMKQLYEELEAVFPEIKRLLTFTEVEALCEKTSRNTSSMLQDVMANRPTEVDAIAGELVRLAKEKGKSLPTLQTLVLLLEAEQMEKGVTTND